MHRSDTDRNRHTDRQRELEEHHTAASCELLRQPAKMKTDNDSQTYDYHLADFISGYQCEQ